MLFAWTATAQTPQPQAPHSQPGAIPSPPPATAPSPGYKPGFLGVFGRWVEDSFAGLNAAWGQLGSLGENAGNAVKETADGAGNVARGAAEITANVTRDTAGAVARFPATRVVAGRERCGTAPNGAPDCRGAAEAICKANGFASGSSIDFETAEKCPPVALLSRREGEPAECILENFVTRAFCQ